MLDDRQAHLYRHWLASWSADGRPPLRSSFDPLDHPRALSTIVLAEFEGGEIRFRVVGTDMVNAWGGDFSGRRLSEIMSGAYHAFIRGLFDEAAESGRAIFSHSQFQWDRGRTLDTRRLMLPYWRDARPAEVGYVLVSQVFDYGTSGPDQPVISVDLDFALLELERKRLVPADL